MKYQLEIMIDLPRARVAELFDNPDNLPKWQEGLQSIEHLSGEVGAVGAKSKLTFQMGKRNMEMLETILVYDLPREFSATFEAKGVFNINKNFFHEAGPNKTRWVSDNEFRFKGFMKIVAFFMKGAFPKQSMKYLKAFKTFAEGEGPA